MNSAWSTVAAAVGGFHYLFHASAFSSAPQRIIRGTHREGEAEDGAERLPVRKAPSPAPSHPTPNPCAEPSPPGSGAQR